MTRIILLLFIVYPMYTAGQFISPCPNLFSYDNIGADSWSGTFRIPITIDHFGIFVKLEFDRPFDELSSDFGDTIHIAPNQFMVQRPGNIKTAAGTIFTFKITAQNNPALGAPQLLGFHLNAVIFCPESGEIPLPPPVESLTAAAGGGALQSPCPGLFSYEPLGVEGSRWYGNISVRSDFNNKGIHIKVILDKPPVDFTAENFGRTSQKEPSEFLIVNPTLNVNVGELIHFRVHADFIPGETPPKLLGYRLNARPACPASGEIGPPMAELPPSPCPSMFQYEPRGPEKDRWYGTFNLRSDIQLNGLWIKVVLDRPSLQLGNWLGEVKSEDNILYKIKNPDYVLFPGKVVPMRFFIKYNPAEPVPKLKEIKMNGHTVCPSSGSRAPSSGSGFQPQNQVTPPSVEWMTTVAPRPSGGDRPRPDWGLGRLPVQASPFQCGEVITRPIPLVVGGAPTEQGEWPWHAALYYTGDGTPEYYCAGVLVSLNHVLTVAHCVTLKDTNFPRNTNDVQVYLGKYLLSKNDKGVQFVPVRKILIHPEYDNIDYVNDIAVLYLTRPAEYTDWVRPVCLWSDSISLNSVVEREGTVVGWGYDSSGLVTDKLLKAVMPVVGKMKCIWSHQKFFKRIVDNSSKNFCAGFRNGTSVCTGDSGGGLVFPMAASNSRWHLRGLVSLSVALQRVYDCDSSHYVVFTDVAQFLPWIEQAFKSG